MSEQEQLHEVQADFTCWDLTGDYPVEIDELTATNELLIQATIQRLLNDVGIDHTDLSVTFLLKIDGETVEVTDNASGFKVTAQIATQTMESGPICH